MTSHRRGEDEWAGLADRFVDGHYGSLRGRVRLFTDGWAPDRPASDPEGVVLQVELEASRCDPYRRLSRLFRLVGQHG